MNQSELKQLILGPIATVATPFDADYNVDFGVSAAETAFWVESGLVAGKSVIKVSAAMGEGPMLRDTEWPKLLETVVRAADGKAAIVCGIHYKDTLRAIEDAKLAQDLGAIGLQISPPIFNAPTQDDILRYYEAVSDAIDIGIMVYNHYWMPDGNIEPDTIRKMADFENVVSIKWGAAAGGNYDEMATFADRFNVIDNTGQIAHCHQLGGRGYISMTTEINPAHDLNIWGLLESGQYDEATAEFDRVNAPLRAFGAKIAAKSGGQARIKKGLLKLTGHPMGDSRPPSLPLNADEMAELRELAISFGWPVVADAVGVTRA